MERIGRYQILGELGRGAMGVVYRAQDPAIGRVVAIKTIRLSDLTDPAERDRLRERLHREAQSAGVLSHPHIVTIYDIAEENDMAFIFMECVNGPPFEKILASQDAPDGELLLTVFNQTAGALDYAHSQGIVHRDIKPANIMLHEGRVAKITDFGVAKILSQQMTQAGAMMGTPNYMSPEQVQGHAVDGRADQFALAVIAYETLTGEKPFLGDYLPTLLYKIVREDPVPPQRLNPTLSPRIEDVLRKALSKNPDDRYPSCSEFIRRLGEACEATLGWHPLARGASQSMPTLAGIPAANRETAAPKKPMAPLPPARPPRHEEPEERNPLVRSLVWMLIGIGLVGLALLGAQKFLFNREPDIAPTQTAQSPPQNPTQQPVASPPDTGSKPSPMPDSSNPAASSSAAQAAQQEPPKPDTPAPRQQNTPRTKPKDSPPQTETLETSPPAASGSDRTVQFVTDPAGAEVVIDNNAALSCRTPCILQLPAGRHVLNTRLNGFRPYPRVINVPQESDVFLPLAKVTATLSVTSEPPGATVEINGEAQHKTTPTLINLTPGTYHVKVVRNHVPVEFDVTLKDNDFIVKTVTF